MESLNKSCPHVSLSSLSLLAFYTFMLYGVHVTRSLMEEEI